MKDNCRLSIVFRRLCLKKVFLCFSSKDRFTVVNSVLYHLKRYGVPVWYDYHELTLGDNRIDGNFNNGLNMCNYAVVIISPNMYDCSCGNDELDVIHKRYIEHNIHVFPLFYNVKATELPEKYFWLTNLIYNEINDVSGSLASCRQIVYKIVSDMTTNHSKTSIKEYLSIEDNYIRKMLNVYNHIDDSNHNAKFSILYALYLYMKSIGVTVDKMCSDTAEIIFKETDLNIPYPHKELLIMEKIVTIMLDFDILNNHRKC